MNRKHLPPAILLVILVSGCTSSETTVEFGNGVIVKEYGPEFSDVYSGECVDFNILIKNTGSVDAEKVFAELLGLDQDWYDNDEISWGKGCTSSGGGPWVNREKVSNEQGCRYTSGGRDLLAPDAMWGVDGETMICSWTYMAPKLPEHMTIDYYPTARVFYTYHTDVSREITLMSSQEMRDYVNSNTPLPTDTQVSTHAPIQIDVVAATPLRVFSDRVEFPIEIRINNVGGGVACIGSSRWDDVSSCKTHDASETWNKLKLEVKSGNYIDVSSDCRDIDITLYKGKDNTIRCDATVSISSLPASRTKDIIEVKAYYNYFLDQEMEITVHGSIE